MSTERYKKIRNAVIAALCVIGGFVALRALLHGPTYYEIRLTTEDYSPPYGPHLPPMWLVERRYWRLIGATEYPMRFVFDEGWQYQRGDKWHDLNADMASDLDVRRLHESGDDREDFR